MIFFFYCELLDAGKYPENFHFLLGDNSSGWISTTSSIKKERERERWFSIGDITINLSNNLSVYCSYESLIELILVVESNLYNTSCVKAFHFFGCVPCFCSLGQTLGFVSFQKIEIQGLLLQLPHLWCFPPHSADPRGPLTLPLARATEFFSDFQPPAWCESICCQGEAVTEQKETEETEIMHLSYTHTLQNSNSFVWLLYYKKLGIQVPTNPNIAVLCNWHCFRKG